MLDQKVSNFWNFPKSKMWNPSFSQSPKSPMVPGNWSLLFENNVLKKLTSLQNSYKIHFFHSALTALLPANKVHFLSTPLPRPPLFANLSVDQNEKNSAIFSKWEGKHWKVNFSPPRNQPSGRQFQYIIRQWCH